MGQYLPILALLVLTVVFVVISLDDHIGLVGQLLERNAVPLGKTVFDTNPQTALGHK